MDENTALLLIIALAVTNLGMVIRMGFLNRRIDKLESKDG